MGFGLSDSKRAALDKARVHCVGEGAGLWVFSETIRGAEGEGGIPVLRVPRRSALLGTVVSGWQLEGGCSRTFGPRRGVLVSAGLVIGRSRALI